MFHEEPEGRQQMTKAVSLYHMTDEYRKLLAHLHDPVTGEIDTAVEERLNELSPDIEKKAIAVTEWVRSLESEKRQLEILEAEIAERKKAYDRKIESWHRYIKDGMEAASINEIRCPLFTLKIRTNPYSTEINDELQIPAEFMRERTVTKTERKPDRAAIREYFLETGEQVPGTHVSQKTRLDIEIDKL